MLRNCVTARGLAPFEESRARGRFKPVIAASILALAGATTGEAAQAGGFFDGSRSAGDFLETGTFNWSGLYFGGHVGGAWGDVDYRIRDSPFLEEGEPVGGIPTAIAATSAVQCDNDSGGGGGGGGNSGNRDRCGISTDLDGAFAGAHLGFNQQVGRFVFGVEASLSGGDLDGSSRRRAEETVGSGSSATTTTDFVSVETQLDHLALVTLRLGYAFDRWLLYFKGGYATGDVEIRGDEETTITSVRGLTEESRFFEDSERHHGYHIGAGIEYAFPTTSCCNNVILGLEYNFIDLDSENHSGIARVFGAEDEFARRRFDIDVDPEGIHTIKARLSYKFGCCDMAAPPPLPPLK